MLNETVNFKQAIIKLRKQIDQSGSKAKALDLVLTEIDVPLWSISLDIKLLEKINDAVERTEKAAKTEFERLLEDI